jgi:predicted NUDIX family NTP pyrophosphohydrolase
LPKGELEPNEDPLAAARREFTEESSFTADGEFVPLGSFRQPGGKTIMAWAFRGDFDVEAVRSNTFTIEWPPKSGRQREFPEIDRAGWFSISEARSRILPGQAPFLDALVKLVDHRDGAP